MANSEDKRNVNYNNYILSFNGKEKHERTPQAELGILAQKKHENAIDDLQYVDDIILQVTLRVKENIQYIISIYATDINKERNMKKCLLNFGNTLKIILIGDFKARIRQIPIQGVIQIFNGDVIKEQGRHANSSMCTARTPHQ